MKPFNSSHLILKDIKSLKDRYQKECVSQNMTVRNLSARALSHHEVDKVFELDIDSEGNGLVALDPCFAYTIWVTETNGAKNNSGDTISQKFHYNIPTLEGYPYNNVLNSEVINKICRVSEENIMIPELPTSIKSCVFTSGNRTYVRKTDNNSTHSSVYVEFEIVDPTTDVQNPQRICIRTSIPEVKNCSNKLSILESVPLRNWNFLTNQTKTRKLADTNYRFHNVHMEMCREKSNIKFEKSEQVITNRSLGDTLVSALAGAFVASVIFGCIMCLCFIKMLKNSQPEDVEEEESIRMNEIALNRSPYMDAGEYVDSRASSTSEKFKSHGMMTKEQAAHLLRGKPEGSWIRRQNESGEERISVLTGDKVKHMTLHQHQIGGASLWCAHTMAPRPMPLNNLIDDYITKGYLGDQILEV